jgi:CHAT domain-containing protein/tetratricopeptide (TPR) repeat protein
MGIQDLDKYLDEIVSGSPNDIETLYRLDFQFYQMAIQGWYDDAMETAIRAYDLAKELDYNPHVIKAIHNLAWMYAILGDFEEAETLYEKAVELQEPHIDAEASQLAQSLLNLGVACTQQRKLAKAQKSLNKTLEIFRRNQENHQENLAETFYWLAFISRANCDFTLAKKYGDEALTIRRNIFDSDHMAIAESLLEMGRLFYQQNRYSDAETFLSDALNILKKDSLEWNTLRLMSASECLIFLAGNYLKTKRFENAIQCIKEGLEIDDQLIGKALAATTERKRLALLPYFYRRYFFAISVVKRCLEQSPEAHSLCFEIVTRRKGLTIEILREQRQAFSDSNISLHFSPKEKQAMQNLTQINIEIGRLALSGILHKDIELRYEKLLQLSQTKERLERKLARQIPFSDIGNTLNSIDIHHIIKSLPKDWALIDFAYYRDWQFEANSTERESLWGDYRYIACIIKPGREHIIRTIDVGKSNDIDDMIAQFHFSITKGQKSLFKSTDTSSVDPTIGYKLRKKLFDPLVSSLDNFKNLLVVPDGHLSTLSFYCLPLRNSRYVIDEYTIHYLNTSRDLSQFSKPVYAKSKAPVVIADPAYTLNRGIWSAMKRTIFGKFTAAERRDHSRSHRSITKDVNTWQFRKLRETRAEGKSIGKLLNVKPTVGEKVLEGWVKLLQSPKIFHIATHGFFSGDLEQEKTATDISATISQTHKGSIIKPSDFPYMNNPLLRSGLALAGAQSWLEGETLPEEAEDGLLTAIDVCGLNLKGTRLVVLSACDTALGDIRNGEGVFGLRRAFSLAGAKAMVASLWKVPDKQTRQLMIQFYENIFNNQAVEVALRNAQRNVKAKYSEPFYWGAFISQGKPGSI